MQLPDNAVFEIAGLQMKRAKDILGFIPGYIRMRDYNGAVNRAYYAAFHALKALEALDQFDSKKHSGLLNYFRMHYVRTGIFSEEYSDILQRLSQTRNDSDYNIIVEITEQDAFTRFEQAKKLVSEIDRYMQAKQ